MGESITEATVLSWLKNVGDTIEQDESVVEVATDKVDTEVPATHGGVLKEILAQVGDVIEVGKTIAIISTESDEEVNGAVSTGLPVEKVADIAHERTPAVMEEALHTGNGLVKMDKSTSGRFLSLSNNRSLIIRGDLQGRIRDPMRADHGNLGCSFAGRKLQGGPR